MKRIVLFSVSSVGFFILLITGFSFKPTDQKTSKYVEAQNLLQFFDSQAPQVRFLKAWAEGDETCNAIGETAFQTCSTLLSGETYQHGALKYFNSMLCNLNTAFPSGAEGALCHFARSMGMNPDKAALPQTISKTFNSKTIILSVVSPTEDFATNLGYDAKGTVTVDDDTFMIIYWGGSADQSKGFMIEGPDGIQGRGESGNRASYLQWDRTTENQFVKVFATKFASSYLSDATSDAAIYGIANYNTSTQSATVNAVSIESQRVTDPAQFGCYRMYGTGTKGGTMKMAKTSDANNNAGESTSSTDTTGAGGSMDAVELPDLTTTANFCQSTPGSGCSDISDLTTIPVEFTRHCNSVFTAGASASDPFGTSGSFVNFEATPSSIFP